MRLIVLSEYFPPDRNSAASQMNDLVNELCSQGHDVILITLSKAAVATCVAGYPKRLTVIPVSVPSKKGGGSARRLFMEIIAPFFVLRHLRKQRGLFDGVDSIIWYAPTIFLWPVIRWLKSLTGAKSYLILRDIFPEWAVSLGLLKKGPTYIFLKLVERLQYRTADVIGVQTPGDLKFLEAYNRDSGTLEVLPQWQTPPPTVQKSEASTHSLIRSKGLRTFVYLGNMGAAQNCGVLIDMMSRMDASRYQLVFVGDGTEKENLKAQAAKLRMNNVRFLNAIAQEDVPSLLSECDVGLIALKASHTTNNLPMCTSSSGQIICCVLPYRSAIYHS